MSGKQQGEEITMLKRPLLGLAPVLAVVAVAAVPAVAQAAPRVFINGKLATTKHESGFSFGAITLHNGVLANLKCENFVAGTSWNEVREGTERGFGETTGYATWECESEKPCQVVNERGVQKEGIFATAEGPPEAKTEKGHRTGNSSLPWIGELTEKEGGRFILTKHVKVWIVVPLGTEMGGLGKGPGCILGGNEIPFEDREGATEKAAGDELEPKDVNGVKNGLTPSKGVFEGEKTEKSGAPETGRLESAFGPGYTTGALVAAGSSTFELVQAK